MIDVSSEIIWTPDVALYNSEIGMEPGSCHPVDCLLLSNGKINCIEPCTHVADCETDYSRWPYDSHNCTLLFGTWMNQANKIFLSINRTTLSTKKVQENGEWKLLGADVNKYTVVLPNKKGAWISVEKLLFTFSIERFSGTLPAMIFVSAVIMVLFNLFAQYIDSKAKERLLMITINIIFHIMALLFFSYHVPDHSETIPKICKRLKYLSEFYLNLAYCIHFRSLFY